MTSNGDEPLRTVGKSLKFVKLNKRSVGASSQGGGEKEVRCKVGVSVGVFTVAADAASAAAAGTN